MIITAIILNYNKYEDVRECILSLEEQKLSKDYTLQILIIDNNSTDGSTLSLRKDFPRHQFVFNKENLGFAKGVNQGMMLHPESDYFLLVNNDAKLEINCLSLLLAESGGKKLVGPALFYTDRPTIIWQGGGIFSQLRMNIIVPDKNQPLSNKGARSVDFLSGCVLLIPKKVINTIGMLDEKFFFYGEDLDFCLRAKKAKIDVRYYPLAHAWHNIKPVAESRTNAFVFKNLSSSYMLIIRKHYPLMIIYGVLLFIFLYTPFRFYQILSGGHDWRIIKEWIRGGIVGLKIKI